MHTASQLLKRLIINCIVSHGKYIPHSLKMCNPHAKVTIQGNPSGYQFVIMANGYFFFLTNGPTFDYVKSLFKKNGLTNGQIITIHEEVL